MDNERLTDSLRWCILEKKLVGKAKRYAYDLNNSKDAIDETLKALRFAFQTNTSVVTEALRSIHCLTFHPTNFERATQELVDCHKLITKLRELGEDVDSRSFVRMLVAKMPPQMLRSLQPLFEENGNPTTKLVLNKFNKFLTERTFVNRFRSKDDTAEDWAASETLATVPCLSNHLRYLLTTEIERDGT